MAAAGFSPLKREKRSKSSTLLELDFLFKELMSLCQTSFVVNNSGGSNSGQPNSAPFSDAAHMLVA